MLVIVANAVDDNCPLNKPASIAPVTEMPDADTLPDDARLPTCAAPLTVKPPDGTLPDVTKFPTCAAPFTLKLPDCKRLVVEMPLVTDSCPIVACPLTLKLFNWPILVIVAK